MSLLFAVEPAASAASAMDAANCASASILLSIEARPLIAPGSSPMQLLLAGKSTVRLDRAVAAAHCARGSLLFEKCH